MFVPFHLLPKKTHPDPDYFTDLKDRWTKVEAGRSCHAFILQEIEKGGGEDFLRYAFEKSTPVTMVGIMENERDLRGMSICEKTIDFPLDDNFEGIDFSYANFYRDDFIGATFLNTYCESGRFYRVRFDKNIFACTTFYGTKFEGVLFKDCRFVDESKFINCDFINCSFEGLFAAKNIFHDCQFDAGTVVRLTLDSEASHGIKEELERVQLPNIFKGIKEAYLAGRVYDEYRHYFFEQKRAERRYVKGGREKVSNLVVELIAGYGVRPSNVLISGFLVLVIFVAIFSLSSCFSLSEGVLMSLAAFAGLGEVPRVTPYNYIYVGEGVIGLIFFALITTVFAKVWFSEE